MPITGFCNLSGSRWECIWWPASAPAHVIQCLWVNMVAKELSSIVVVSAPGWCTKTSFPEHLFQLRRFAWLVPTYSMLGRWCNCSEVRAGIVFILAETDSRDTCFLLHYEPRTTVSIFGLSYSYFSRQQEVSTGNGDRLPEVNRKPQPEMALGSRKLTGSLPNLKWLKHTAMHVWGYNWPISACIQL